MPTPSRFLRLLAPALCLLFVPAHAQINPQRHQVTLSKTGFSILMPGTPKREDGSQYDQKTGAKALSESLSLYTNDGAYLAVVMRLNDAARADLVRHFSPKNDPVVFFADEMFGNFVTKHVESPERVPKTKKPIRFSGLSGTETTYIAEKDGRSVVTKTRLMTDKYNIVFLLAGGITPAVKTSTLDRYLNSARLGRLPAELRGSTRPAK